MPLPFPGMDPFIEFQLWDDFHGRFVGDIADALVPLVRPRYVVRYERRVYIEHDPDDPQRFVVPDVSVAAHPADLQAAAEQQESPVATLNPVEVLLPMPVMHREAFLTIRERETLEVITVIEVLSPGNKRPGSDGHRLYLAKRDEILESSAALVELDLLRGGKRLPTVNPLPAADYYAFVCRAKQRPKATVYAWTIRQPLPSIPIPLRSEADVTLELQRLFTNRFDRAGYDYSLNYDVPQDPPFREEDAERVRQLLATRNR